MTGFNLLKLFTVAIYWKPLELHDELSLLVITHKATQGGLLVAHL